MNFTIRFAAYAFTLIACGTMLTGCDPEHRKKCEWYLMPDQDNAKSDSGLIRVCARNFTTNKQDCRLQTKLEFAKETYNKRFRYVDMKYDSPGIPRTITEIKFCE